ncbi:hypothetical protein, partial [Klebsiella variicola]|uniref:hypothetical protein n=1 Tax=Klebsiella variicola TaxID=244366 RepID=UPI001C4FA6DB
YLTIEKLFTLSLFLAPLGDIKIKQCPPIHSLRERVGSTDGCLPQANTVSFGKKVNVNTRVFLTKN